MAVFGGYETVRELYRGGLASACTARKAGAAGPARFVVKSYQPMALEADADRLRAEIEAFLDGARAQRKCAASGAPHWAAVHEVGEVQGGAYFVTDFHGRSVQHLIRGRVKLDGRGLYGIVSAVVQGLVEIKKACGRPHGNLKPPNVLLAGKGDLTRAQVLLTDPAGASQLDPQMGDVPDFRAVGEMIYQLVLHRTGRAMGGWPVPESKEWDRLGKDGAAWRQLCSRLLNPNLAPGLLTFEDLAHDLEQLKRAPAALSPKVLLPVAALMLLIAGGVIAFTALSLAKRGADDGPAQDVFDPSAWQRLCNHFGNWLEPLLASREAGRLQAWQDDPYLRKTVLPMLEEVVRRANPRVIAGQSWGDVQKLGENPTQKAKEKAAVRQTVQALEIVDLLQGSLCSDEWPAFGRAQRAAQVCAGRGWEGPAAHIRSLLPFPDRDVEKRVSALLALQVEIQRIEDLWKEVEGLQAAIAGWDDPVLKRIGQYVQAEARGAAGAAGPDPVGKLREKLTDLTAANGLLHRLAEFIRSDRAGRLDSALLRRNPPFQLAPDGALTDEVLRGGLAVLASGRYDVKADPRTPAWRAQVADSLTARAGDIENLRRSAANLLADEKVSGKDREDLQGVLGAVGEYQKTVESLRQTLAAVSAPPAYNFDSRQSIDNGMRDLDAGLKELIRTMGASDQEFRNIEKHIADARQLSLEELRTALRARAKVSATGLAEIDQAWVAQRDALLKDEPAAEGLREKSNRLEAFLRDLEASFPPELGADVEQRPWNRALVTTDLEANRRSAVSSSLSYVTWAKVLAGQADPDFTGPRDKLLEAYNGWRTGVAEIVPAFNRIQDALNAGHLPAEQPPSLGATLGDLCARQQAKPIFSDGAVKPALEPVVSRLTKLKEAETLTDPQALLAMVNAGRQGQFESARAAWLRLGRLGTPWPDKPDDLRQEVECRKNLGTLYGLASDSPHKAALLQELAGESRRRWEAYLLSRSDAAEIDAAVARMGDFGLKAEDVPSLSAFAQFRLAMQQFRQEVTGPSAKMDDAAVRDLAGRFCASLEALPAAFTQRAEVAGLVRDLRDVEAAAGGGVDLSKAGPAGAGWQMSQAGDGTLTYSLGGVAQRLTFGRVNAPSGPCFLAKTEVPVGLFARVVAAAQKTSEMDKLLPSDDDAVGIRGWARQGGGLAAGGNWFPIVPPVLAGRMYPANVSPQPPSANGPMQQLSLAAAVYFCRLLNCRLPTSAEWRAAYEADKLVRSARPYNLRDATWQAQKNHAASLEQSGDLLDPERYYPDAGVFWPKDVAANQRKVGADAEVAAGAPNDGHLWFADVQYDDQRLFQHLVGNVAEFVYEKPDDLIALKSPTADEVRQFLAGGGTSARVVGGSALSAPQVPVDQPREMSSPAAVEGFSDVGFRPAFAAGPEPLHARLLRLLQGLANQGYLVPLTP